MSCSSLPCRQGSRRYRWSHNCRWHSRPHSHRKTRHTTERSRTGRPGKRGSRSDFPSRSSRPSTWENRETDRRNWMPNRQTVSAAPAWSQTISSYHGPPAIESAPDRRPLSRMCTTELTDHQTSHSQNEATADPAGTAAPAGAGRPRLSLVAPLTDRPLTGRPMGQSTGQQTGPNRHICHTYQTLRERSGPYFYRRWSTIVKQRIAPLSKAAMKHVRKS